MATLNNAQYWRVDHDHGVIAHGRYADVLLVSDLNQLIIDQVYANGELVAESGRLLKELPIPPIPDYARNRVQLKRPLRASDFEIPAPSNRTQVNAYVLKPRYFSRDLGPLAPTEGPQRAG
jgi:adenine deaminase